MSENAPEQAAAEREAMLRLLDRTAPEGYLAEWQRRLRQPPEEERLDTRGALVFRLNHEWLALEAAAVHEIVADSPVHRIPQRTNAVLRGLVNVRGELQLCVSLHALLGLQSPDGEATTFSRRVHPRMVVFAGPEGAFVFRSEEVYGVQPLDEAALQAAPVTVGKAMATYTRGLFDFKDTKVGLLDHELVLHALRNQYL